MPNPPSAAQSLYPHLPSAAREPVKQSDRSLAAAMYPTQTPEAKARERRKQQFLADLRELTEQIRRR
jgi:hypothetical protein